MTKATRLSQAQMTQLQAAQQALMQGQPQKAHAEAQALAQAQPNSPDACLLYAMVLAEQQNFADSEQWFEKALALAPGNALILSNFGQMQRRARRFEKAISCFKTLTQSEPKNPSAWLSLGQTEQMAGRIEAAIDSLKKAVELKPDLIQAWQSLAQCHRSQYEYDQAEQALSNALQCAPGQPRLHFDLGNTLRLKGDSQAALLEYAKAEKASFSGPELTDAKVGALLDLGQPAEAIELAKKMVAEHPGFTRGYKTLAHLLWEYGEAVGERLSAQQAYQQAIAKTDAMELRIELVRFLLEAREHEQALAQIQTLADANHPSIVALHAHALEGLDRTEQAAPLYRQAFEHFHQHAPFLNDYCRHLIKSRDWSSAEKMAQAALDLNPLDQEALAYLGTIWRMMGDEREFWLCDYEKVVTIEPIQCPETHPDLERFLSDLTATLNGIHQASREPLRQSLRNGSQTAGRLFGRPDPMIASTQRQLTQSIEQWLSRLPKDAEHPFLSRNQHAIRYTGSWSVKLWSTGKHVNHIHSEGWISSAFYVSLPPSVLNQTTNNHAGAIQFGQPPVELGLDLEPRRIIHPKPGHVALFPSYMWHGTVPFDDPDPRITMAFDMIPRISSR